MAPIEYADTIIGQYGRSADGEKPAFKDEDDVPDDSQCATFCAAVGHIDNERWAGVPFLLKAGKGTQPIHPPPFLCSLIAISIHPIHPQPTN